ncbi:MAG: hypothetical protein ACOVRJ_02270 [Roseateles sp.]
MSCIEKPARRVESAVKSCLPRVALGFGVGLAAFLSGCSNLPSLSKPAARPASPVQERPEPTPADRSSPVAPKAPEPAKPTGLGPPKQPHSHAELRAQAAQRLIAANPEMTYLGEVPAVLLAIPVLEVELRHDGSIKTIHVLRRPGQAPETLQMAIEAIHRAAPFGNVSRLPEPWKFSETFLFNDQRRFKPRTLD